MSVGNYLCEGTGCTPWNVLLVGPKSGQPVDSLSYYLHGFIHPRWLFGISSINSTSLKNAGWETIFLWGLGLFSGHVFNFSEGNLSHTRAVLGRNLFNFANAQRQSDQTRNSHFCHWHKLYTYYYWSNYDILPTGFPWNKGISLTKPPFGVRSCELAIIWPNIIPGIKFTFVLMGKCWPEMLQQLLFKTWLQTRKVIFLNDTTSFVSNPQEEPWRSNRKSQKNVAHNFSSQYTYLTKHPASKSYKSIKHDNDYSALTCRFKP